MASAQEPGNLRIVVANPSGKEEQVASNAIYWFGPGGSADGVIQNTPEKWNHLPLSSVVGGPGYKIRIYATTGADTLDASDSACVLPVNVNGNQDSIGNSAHVGGLGTANFTVTKAWADLVMVADDERLLYEVTAKEGVYFRVGGGKVFISVEDDTA